MPQKLMKSLAKQLKQLPSRGKTALKNAPLDFHFALWLICGALVLAVVSWMLPTMAHIPMTADMKGTVGEMYESYGGKRITYRLEDNTVGYTIPLETLESLSARPKVGDQVIFKYEITSVRDIRMLKLIGADGAEQVLYQAENTALKALYRNQWIAFGLYAVFAAGCILVYRRKQKQSEN